MITYPPELLPIADGPADVIVVDGCGCVFCDLELESAEREGLDGLWHYHEDQPPWAGFGGDYIRCTRTTN